MEISEKHLVIRAELSLLFLQLKYSTKAFSVELSRISVLEQVQLSTLQTYNMPCFENNLNFQQLVIKCKSKKNSLVIKV